MKTRNPGRKHRFPCSFLLGMVICMCGCHTAWIASNASAVTHRLASSRPHQQVMSDLDETSRLRSQLELLPDVLNFARMRGLQVGNAYQRIDSIAGPVSWIVVAADPNTLSLHHWSFPLVGKVPYKGYRFLDHAQQEANQLSSLGWESEVMAVEAWSSLGWFPEPMPASLLELPEHRWVTTLLHELVHRTIHLPSNAQWNEGLATFLGNRLAQEWLVSRHGEDGDESTRHRLRYQDEMRLNRLLREYREGLLAGHRRQAHQQFLQSLEDQPWEAFSGAKLASERWSLPRVLMAEIYDPEAFDWERMWAESAQDLSNLAIWGLTKKDGTGAAESSSGPVEGDFRSRENSSRD